MAEVVLVVLSESVLLPLPRRRRVVMKRRKSKLMDVFFLDIYVLYVWFRRYAIMIHARQIYLTGLTWSSVILPLKWKFMSKWNIVNGTYILWESCMESRIKYGERMSLMKVNLCQELDKFSRHTSVLKTYSLEIQVESSAFRGQNSKSLPSNGITLAPSNNKNRYFKVSL